jgi:hypothetical protein
MKSSIKLFELMNYEDKKYNGAVRSTNLNRKTADRVLSTNAPINFTASTRYT